MALTLAEWEARAVWHLEQADALLSAPIQDGTMAAGRASAHARTAAAIAQLKDSKVLK